MSQDRDAEEPSISRIFNLFPIKIEKATLPSLSHHCYTPTAVTAILGPLPLANDAGPLGLERASSSPSVRASKKTGEKETLLWNPRSQRSVSGRGSGWPARAVDVIGSGKGSDRRDWMRTTLFLFQRGDAVSMRERGLRVALIPYWEV